MAVSRLSQQADHVIVMRNPKAGARDRDDATQQLVKLLSENSLHVEILTDLEQLPELSARLFESGRLRTVIAAGGDGTISTVANLVPAGVPVSVFPLGTENLLAKYLSVTANPSTFCQMIVEGHLAHFDTGRTGDRMFLLMASFGFDAEVVRRLHEQRDGHIHHLSYAKPIVDSIRNYEYPELRVTFDADSVENSADAGKVHMARWVFVVNLPRYAFGINIVPDAEGNDGLLDVCMFREGSLWHGLRYMSGVLLGQHRQMEGCTIVRTRRVRVEAEEKVPYQIDGDPGGYTPAEISIEPQRLTLVVPKAWNEQHSLDGETTEP